MSKNIPVYYEQEESYRIHMERDFNRLPELIQGLIKGGSRKLCIVTDSNVQPLYGALAQELLRDLFQFCGTYVFPAGEASKHTDTVGGVYEYLITHQFDRKDLLLALGGGVVGDLTGFTAATYLRGIDFIQVPTTLLSQVDSSIGGKTGVDFMQYKNMVGAFYMPKLVYMNLDVLKSLPEEQFSSGMGEILKHGQIKDADYFEYVSSHRKQILEQDPKILEEMIGQSCLIKRDVVQKDPKEQGERALLNFGHTIGHAVEKLSDFHYSHGACVALGMVAAAHISKQLGNLTEEQFSFLCDTISGFGLPTRLSSFEHSPEQVLAATRLDKKMESGKVKFILLSRPGEAYITRELSDEQILDGIRILYP